MWPCEVVASWPAPCSHTLDAPLTKPAQNSNSKQKMLTATIHQIFMNVSAQLKQHAIVNISTDDFLVLITRERSLPAIKGLWIETPGWC
jgi:hypothetical protein